MDDTPVEKYAKHLRTCGHDNIIGLRMHLEVVFKGVTNILFKPSRKEPVYRYPGTDEEFIAEVCEAWRKRFGTH